MKTYLKSTQGLASAPEALATFTINSVPVSIQLGELGPWLKKHGLTRETIRGVKVNDIDTGIFPVIEVKTERAAKALQSVIKKSVTKADVPDVIEVGDGWSFNKQSWARDVYNEIRALGVGLDELKMEWMLGKPKGLSAHQMELALNPPKKVKTKEQLAAEEAAILEDIPPY
jgi:hypothetical protein